MSIDKLNRESPKKGGSPEKKSPNQDVHFCQYGFKLTEEDEDQSGKLPLIKNPRSHSVPDLSRSDLDFIEKWIKRDPDREPFHPSISKLVEEYKHRTSELQHDEKFQREMYKQAKKTLLNCDSIKHYKDVTLTDR